MDKSGDVFITGYTVGEPFNKKFDTEGAVFEVYDDQCIVFIGLENATESEINSVSQGEMTFALTVIDRIIFVSAEFGGGWMMQMPFNAALCEDFNLIAGKTYPVLIVLADIATNIVKAIRVMSMSREFSELFCKNAANQLANPITNYDSKVSQVFEQFTEKQIYQKACVVFNTASLVSTEATTIILM